MRVKYTDVETAVFEEARKLYPGSKRGLQTEFANFKWRCKHPVSGGVPMFVVSAVLPILKPAIEQQIIWRRKDGRYWKNFQTWINNHCWEEEGQHETPIRKDTRTCRLHGKPVTMDVAGEGFCGAECYRESMKPKTKVQPVGGKDKRT